MDTDGLVLSQEPVKNYEKLTLPSGKQINCLRSFYNSIGNPEKRELASLQMQMVALATLARQYAHLKYLSSDNRFYIMERGLHSVEVFTHTQYKLNYLSETSYAIIQMMHKQLALTAPEPELIFLLTASPRTLMRRISRRQRPSEQNLKMQYLQELSHSYMTLLGPKAIVMPPCNDSRTVAEKIYALITLYRTNMTHQDLQAIALTEQCHWGLLKNPVRNSRTLAAEEDSSKEKTSGLRDRRVTFDLSKLKLESSPPTPCPAQK